MFRLTGSARILASVFMAAALPVLAATQKLYAQQTQPGDIYLKPYAQAGHTYWRDQKTKSIYDMWECAETDARGVPSGRQSICMVAYHVSTENKDARDELAKQLEVRPHELTARDKASTCGFGPRIYDVREQRDGHKAELKIGLDWPRENGNGYKEGKTFNVEFKRQGDVMRMQVSPKDFVLARETRVFRQVAPEELKSPPCVPPPITAPAGRPLPPPFVVVTHQ